MQEMGVQSPAWEDLLEISFDVPKGENSDRVLKPLPVYETEHGTASYDVLPKELKDYLKAIEQQTGVNIRAVSISPDRKDVLFKQ